MASCKATLRGLTHVRSKTRRNIDDNACQTGGIHTRNGLVVDGRLTRASGVCECLSAVDLADAHIPKGGTLAGDKGFDTADFVAELRDLRITPHVAQNTCDTGKAKRRSNIDGRTTRHAGYAASQKCRKRIEEILARPGLLTMALSGMDRCAAARDG